MFKIDEFGLIRPINRLTGEYVDTNLDYKLDGRQIDLMRRIRTEQESLHTMMKRYMSQPLYMHKHEIENRIKHLSAMMKALVEVTEERRANCGWPSNREERDRYLESIDQEAREAA